MEDCSGTSWDDIPDDEWKRLLLELRKYVKSKNYILPADVESDDIACLALERVLAGSRKWNRKKCPDLLELLKWTANSILSKIWKLECNKTRLTETETMSNVDALENFAVPDPDECDESYLDERLNELRSLAEGDDELTEFVLAIEYGASSRQEIAEKLGWDLKRVYSVTRRLKTIIQDQLKKGQTVQNVRG